MHISDGSHKLGKDLLDLRWRDWSIMQEVVVEFIPWQREISRRHGSWKFSTIPGQYSKTSQTRFSVTITSYSRAM